MIRNLWACLNFSLSTASEQIITSQLCGVTMIGYWPCSFVHVDVVSWVLMFFYAVLRFLYAPYAE